MTDNDQQGTNDFVTSFSSQQPQEQDGEERENATDQPLTDTITSRRDDDENDNDNDNADVEDHEISAMDSNKEEISNIPSLVVALGASLTTGGTTYSFGLYGATLQQTLHLHESQVNTISTAFFFAGLFSFLPGLCSDTFGTRIALISGGCLGCLHLLLYWAVARQYIVVPHFLLVPLLSILGIGTYLSSALVTGAVFKTITVACQGGPNKGTAVGIAKGYVGLGSGLYVAIFVAIRKYQETNLDFLPMAATFCICCVVLPGFFLLPSKLRLQTTTFRDDTTFLHYQVLYASLFAMAVVIVGSSVADLLFHKPQPSVTDLALLEALSDEPVALRPTSSSSSHRSTALFLVAIWLLPIYSFFILPKKVQEQSTPSSEAARNDDDDDDDHDNNNDEDLSLLETSDHHHHRALQPRKNSHSDKSNDVINSVHDVDTEENALDRYSVPGERITDDDLDNDDDDDDNTGDEENKNLVEMLQTPSAMLMLWTTTILVGAGTLESNNMDKMVAALGFQSNVAEASLAIFSVAQAAARVFTGALSEAAAHWKNVHWCMDPDVGGVPRPFFLVLSAVIGLGAHITLGLASSQTAFVSGAALSGAAFGMVWPLMVLIIGEVFGPQNIGANYMFFDGFTSAAGTFLLSKIVAQDVYQAHIPAPNHPSQPNDDDDDSNGQQPNDNDDDDAMCYGTDCYRLTHWIVAALSVSCIVSSIIMQHRTKAIYRKKLILANYGGPDRRIGRRVHDD